MTIKPLSPIDATWLVVESREMPMHVGLLLEFSLPTDSPDTFLKTQRESMRGDFELPPPWNLVPVHAPVAGALPMVREVADVDLDHHVRWWGLPSPGDQRELGVLVSRLHTQQLDLRRPLWEFHVIEGLADGRFAVFVKLHHSVVDGATAMMLINKALSTGPHDASPHLFTVGVDDLAQQETEPVAKPHPLQGLLGAIATSATTALGVGAAGVGLAKSALGDSALQVPFAQASTPLGGRITGQRRLATQQYDLAQVKALAKASGVKINDIVLYLSSTALRSYLAEQGKEVKGSMSAAVPVNLRRPGDTTAGTVVASMMVDLATNIEDPLERLAAIHASGIAAKDHLPESPDAAMAYSLSLAMPWVVGLLAGINPKAPHSLTISNVPGPPHPLYWNGARLDAMYPMSLLFHGTALNITCISYDGKLNFGFTGARDSLPHLQRLATAMGAALAELTEIFAPGTT